MILATDRDFEILALKTSQQTKDIEAFFVEIFNEGNKYRMNQKRTK